MYQVDQYLYDPNLLSTLDFRKSPAKLKPYITAADPGEPWMIVRPLKESDYDKGFLQLLSQLTAVGNISRLDFLRKLISIYRTQILTKFSIIFVGKFAQMKSKGDYFVTVIEDTRKQLIIGAATLVIEHKFIHDCGLVSIYTILFIFLILPSKSVPQSYLVVILRILKKSEI